MHLDDFNNIESLGIFILFFFFPSFLVLKRAHEFSKHQPVSDSTVCDLIILLQLFPVSLAFQAFFIFCWPNLIWKLSKCAIDIFWNQHHSCLFIEQAITSSKVDKQKQKEVRQRCRERERRSTPSQSHHTEMWTILLEIVLKIVRFEMHGNDILFHRARVIHQMHTSTM